MSRASHALFAALMIIAAVPLAAHASDVTIDYSQLNSPAANDIDAPTLSTLRQPIRIHPLAALAYQSSTVKNLAAITPLTTAAKSEIHLHPPAPKALAAVQTNSEVPVPLTSIDLAMAAVQPVRPAEETGSPAGALTEPDSNTDLALNQVAPPAVSPEPPASSKKELANLPVYEPEPKPSKDLPDDETLIVPVHAVAGKMDDLNPDDVVGLDFGRPNKSTDN